MTAGWASAGEGLGRLPTEGDYPQRDRATPVHCTRSSVQLRGKMEAGGTSEWGRPGRALGAQADEHRGICPASGQQGCMMGVRGVWWHLHP